MIKDDEVLNIQLYTVSYFGLHVCIVGPMYIFQFLVVVLILFAGSATASCTQEFPMHTADLLASSCELERGA